MFKAGDKIKWNRFEWFGEGEVLDKAAYSEDYITVRFSDYEHYQDKIAVGVFDYHEIPKNEATLVTKQTKDMVNSPAHYNFGSIECIDYLKDNMPHDAFLGYLEGNAKKYMHRWRYKGKSTEDIKKAIWYQQRLLKELEAQGSNS